MGDCTVCELYLNKVISFLPSFLPPSLVINKVSGMGQCGIRPQPEDYPERGWLRAVRS
jgi:hypothetical protein